MQIKSILEAMLFAHGEPLELTPLAELAGCSAQDARAALKELAEEYQSRGLVLLEKDDAFQIGTHPDAHDFIQKLIKSDLAEKLSRSALETLAIVAYKGPLSRAEIDYLRGVNSSYTLRNLLMRGLVERIERADDGRGYRYGINFEFLRHFGLSHVHELPKYKDLHAAKVEIPETPEEHAAINDKEVSA